MTTMTEYCRFFLSGYCKYGEYCRFRHDFDTLLNEGICSLWAAGYFCDGRCYLSHPSSEHIAALGQMPLPDEDHCTPTSSNFADIAAAPICKFYIKDVCSKGSTCPFLHETPTMSGEKPPTKRFDNEESPNKPEQPLAMSDCHDVSIAEDVCQTQGCGNGGKREDVATDKGGIGAPAATCTVKGGSVIEVEGGITALSGQERESYRAESLEGGTDGTGRIVRTEMNQAPTLSAHSTIITRPCWFYAQGRCRKGAACLFSHAMQSARNVKNEREPHSDQKHTLDTAMGEGETAVTGSGQGDGSASQSMVKAKVDEILRKRRRFSTVSAADDAVRGDSDASREKRRDREERSPRVTEIPSKRRRPSRTSSTGDGTTGAMVEFPTTAQEGVGRTKASLTTDFPKE